MVWCTLRTRDTLFMMAAVWGRRSLISMSGQADRIGRWGPRTPSSAEGFMSKVSRWLGPPH